MNAINMTYISDNVQRTLKVQECLQGHELMGITPGDIAKTTKITPSNVTRCLHNLAHHGTAEQHPSVKGRWRLSVSYLVRTANSVLRELDKVNASVYDMKRYQVER